LISLSSPLPSLLLSDRPNASDMGSRARRSSSSCAAAAYSRKRRLIRFGVSAIRCLSNDQAFIRRASRMADKTSWTKPLAPMTYGDSIVRTTSRDAVSARRASGGRDQGRPGARGLVQLGFRLAEHTSGLQSPCNLVCRLFFVNDTATTEIYTLSLHDALPICFYPPCVAHGG